MTPILKKKLHWLPVRHCIVLFIDPESETKRHFKTYLFKKARNSFQFYQMINMFNYLRIFSICLFLYIDIEIFFSLFPLSFSFFMILTQSTMDNQWIWRCINTFSISIYNTCTYDIGKNTLTLMRFPSSIQERRKRMLVLVKALLGIENS